MGYRKAEEILPMEVIEIIQRYVDGENIYIPRKEKQRKQWGSNTLIRKELEDRNELIWMDYQNGANVKTLAINYFLSEKSIQRILRSRTK